MIEEDVVSMGDMPSGCVSGKSDDYSREKRHGESQMQIEKPQSAMFGNATTMIEAINEDEKVVQVSLPVDVGSCSSSQKSDVQMMG